jgi:hypothetical protein
MENSQNVPSPFSSKLPTLQLVWDSTSLRSLQFCPRSYQLGIIGGYRGSAIDLEFGVYFASAAETYAKSRLAGRTKDDATMDAVEEAVLKTWSEENGPWRGKYEELWRCTGVNKYRNKKGNAAKCPYSHKGRWFPGDKPSTCGECGSPTVSERRFIPEDTGKNRNTLLRIIAWYCMEQPETKEDGGLFPYAFPNGKPAVELSFKVPLPWKASTGEQFILSGHLDGIKTWGSDHFISDNKTTKSWLGEKYWAQYSPNIQVDTYDLVGTLLWPQLKLQGMAIEAAQTLVGGAKFGINVFYRTEGQREETLADIQYWLGLAEKFAKDNYWPMNKTNCKMCSFQRICSKDPAQRERYLNNGDFERKQWNPLEER